MLAWRMRAVLSLTGRAIACRYDRLMAARADPISRVRLQRAGAVAVAALGVLVIPGAPATAASPPAAACQEYVVCGQPAGGPSGNGGNPASAGLERSSQRQQRPSVSSQADLPLTAYPVTPALVILAGVLLAGLLAAMAVRLARGGDDRRVPATSGRAR
jgi:hypothetical protein